MSRTQLCLQNALEKRRNNPNWPTSKLSTSVDLEDGDCLSDLEFDFEEESRPFSISSTPINIKKQPSKLMGLFICFIPYLANYQSLNVPSLG